MAESASLEHYEMRGICIKLAECHQLLHANWLRKRDQSMAELECVKTLAWLEAKMEGIRHEAYAM